MNYKHLPKKWCSLELKRNNTIYNEAMESSPIIGKDDDTRTSNYLYNVLPPTPHWHFVKQPEVTATSKCYHHYICVNRTATQLEGDTVGQAEKQQ
jgi:hypothetical protein